jgi:hypothetical protein
MRLLVTSLVLLGDYAYSSEFDNRFDIDMAAGNDPVQSYQSAALNDDGAHWAPGPTGDNAIRPRICIVPETISIAISRFTHSTRKYSSLNPRAPPLQIA